MLDFQAWLSEQLSTTFSSAARTRTLSFAAAAALAMSGCAALSGGRQGQGSWMKDGGLALSRPVPPSNSAASRASVNDPILGFMPSKHTHAGRWLRIDRSNKRIEIMDGSSSLSTISGDGIQGLKPGKYTIMHKQQTPLWYAPDQYFAARLLNIPASSNADRYRRGALGSSALFIDENTPIHDGPVWREEIGGVRVGEEEVGRLFTLLDVGSVVEVR